MASNMTREEIINASKNMEPAELIDKLNKDATNFIDQLPKGKKEKLWTLEDWDKQLKTHPLFMTKPPKEGEEMPPLLEALQSLKYDPNENSADELAKSYKDDGNENFKRKKYRWAVDSYTEGLKTNCPDQELLVQLYSNRAAAHYHIGNYEKSLKDASEAKKIKPNHTKALERGALCCFQLKKLTDCISWCEEGLKIHPENKVLTDLKQKATEKKKIEDRDKRKAQILKAKEQKSLQNVLKVIDERKIQLGNDNLVNDAQPAGPVAVSAKVHLDENKCLIWPVMFLYPEYGTSDYIQEFHEDSIFLDHLKEMFERDPPSWDTDKKYNPEKLRLYFMDGNSLITVKPTVTLRQVVSHKRYKIYDGTPCFLITVRDSTFDKDFRAKYTVCK